MAKKNNTVGIDNIVESAFVPQSETHKRAQEMHNALREEAGARPVLSISDFFDNNFKVPCDRKGTPKEGMHMVTLRGEPEVREGRENAYIRMELRNELGVCWTTAIGAENLSEILVDISYNNNGMLAGKKGMAALAFLKNHDFACWTLMTENGKVATYFNEIKYNRRVYAMELNRERQMPEAPAPEKAPWEK